MRRHLRAGAGDLVSNGWLARLLTSIWPPCAAAAIALAASPSGVEEPLVGDRGEQEGMVKRLAEQRQPGVAAAHIAQRARHQAHRRQGALVAIAVAVRQIAPDRRVQPRPRQRQVVGDALDARVGRGHQFSAQRRRRL